MYTVTHERSRFIKYDHFPPTNMYHIKYSNLQTFKVYFRNVLSLINSKRVKYFVIFCFICAL